MFTKVDCLRLQVRDLNSAISFYNEKLGLDIVWKRNETEAGLRLKESDTEIVLVKEDLDCPEVDFKVEDVLTAVEGFKEADGKVLVEPFEIPIGKCSVVQDPWNNRFVLLDSSKGCLKWITTRMLLNNSGTMNSYYILVVNQHTGGTSKRNLHSGPRPMTTGMISRSFLGKKGHTVGAGVHISG